MENVTDILLSTRNRRTLLENTLNHIYTRTKRHYRLHVVDDQSNDGTLEFLLEEFQAKRVNNLYLRGNHAGAMCNLNLLAWAGWSDVVVLVDDDILCPNVKPCWLERGLTAMDNHPELGMLALNHPGAKKKGFKTSGNVTYCESLGGTFLFVRRTILEVRPLPHIRGLMDGPMAVRCLAVRNAGWKIGYLAKTYCYHSGRKSVLTGGAYRGRFIDPENWETLEPPVKWRG